ncbi:unnamed protein product, partial [Rotaria magnacalcarata]
MSSSTPTGLFTSMDITSMATELGQSSLPAKIYETSESLLTTASSITISGELSTGESYATPSDLHTATT